MSDISTEFPSDLSILMEVVAQHIKAAENSGILDFRYNENSGCDFK